MSYSLNDFCNDTRSILAEHDDHEGREQVRQKLEQLVVDPDFRAEYLGDDAAPGVQQIHEDPQQFCVLTYNMTAPRTSPPHDHGESWAVYGQAVGHTDMTIWRADDDNVYPVRTFRLEPGQAGRFDVREIPSIDYAEGAKFVRVTGVDLAKISRRVFDPVTGAVREIEHVATGPAPGSVRTSRGAGPLPRT
jgi:predicted metal-dependent enzyme (double-stranded beta helix superfamily)